MDRIEVKSLSSSHASFVFVPLTSGCSVCSSVFSVLYLCTLFRYSTPRSPLALAILDHFQSSSDSSPVQEIETTEFKELRVSFTHQSNKTNNHKIQNKSITFPWVDRNYREIEVKGKVIIILFLVSMIKNNSKSKSTS